jgi:hypothetical protein
MTTESHDLGLEGEFREMVRRFGGTSFGRMVQIVDEECRAEYERSRGLPCITVICRKCDTLLEWATGKPYRSRSKKSEPKLKPAPHVLDKRGRIKFHKFEPPHDDPGVGPCWHCLRPEDAKVHR